MAVTNAFSCILFVGNCWWESVGVCYVAFAVPLALQTAWALCRRGGGLRGGGLRDGGRRGGGSQGGALRDGALWDGLWFGLLVGALWPLGEGVVVNVFGWWGEYLAPGLFVWETPLYCMLIGWLASTHIFYWGRRILEIGYSAWTASVASGLTAFGLGILGENLFVGARMWVYEPSRLDWWGVPAFVPIAYGLAYAVVPALRRMHIVAATLVFASIILVVSVGLGLLTGFFPR